MISIQLQKVGFSPSGQRRLAQAFKTVSMLTMIGLLGACGGAQASATQVGVATDGVVVEMNDRLRYEPDALTVKRGDTVTFVTTGSAPHNVVTDATLAKDPAHAAVPEGAEVFTSPMAQSGESWQYTFETPGTYTYFCQPHEVLGMVATITVTE